MISLFCKWIFRNKLLLLLEARSSSSSSSSRSNDQYKRWVENAFMGLQWVVGSVTFNIQRTFKYYIGWAIFIIRQYQTQDSTENKNRNKTYNKHITIYNVSSSSSNKSTTTGCLVLVVFNALQLMISEEGRKEQKRK